MWKYLVLLGIGLCVIASRVYALAFYPTESEWLIWPGFCKARYVVSGAGISSVYAGRVPSEVVKSYMKRYSGSWYGLHHYCAAWLILRRARDTKDVSKRSLLARRVISESQYTLMRTAEGDFMRDEIRQTMVQAHDMMGDYEGAVRYAKESIAEHPGNPKNYTVYAWLLAKSRRTAEALEVLEKGNEYTNGNSAELNYILATLLLKTNRIKEAIDAAATAYANGYPLPGLAAKLKKIGVWKNVEQKIKLLRGERP